MEPEGCHYSDFCSVCHPCTWLWISLFDPKHLYNYNSTYCITLNMFCILLITHYFKWEKLQCIMSTQNPPTNFLICTWNTLKCLYRVIQEESALLWEMIVWVIQSKKSSYEHGFDFERLRRYDRLKLGIEGNDYWQWTEENNKPA